MREKLKYAIPILIVLQIFNLFQINSLKRELEMLNTNQGHSTEFIRSEMNNIYNNIDNIIRQDLSLIQDAEVELGDLDGDNLQVELKYSLTPKEVRDNTKLFLQFEGESIEMDRVGNSFSKNLKQDIFSEYNYPEIIIKEKDLLKTTEDSRIVISDLKEKIFPSVNLVFAGSYISRDDSIQIDGPIDFFDRKEYTEISLKDPKFVITLNNRIVKEENISIKELHDDFMINEEFKIGRGEILTLKVVFMDDLDLRHEFILEEFSLDEDWHPQGLTRELIYSKDNELLWEGEVY